MFVSICCILCHINQLWCGLLSCIHLWVTDQRWQTGPNESALYFEVFFVFCWHQIGKLVQVVFYTLWFFCSKFTKIRHRFLYWIHWNKFSNWKAYLACVYMIFWRDCWQKFVSMLHLWVFLDFWHFLSLLTNYAVAYCHAYIYG